MKHGGLVTLILVAVLSIAAGVLGAADSPGREMAVVDFQDKTLLGTAVLQGKYIFVHDDELMSSGQACFYVYEYAEDQTGKPEARRDKLVFSFRCQRVQHSKAAQIVMTYGMTPSGMFELREIQFPGSTEGHRVP
jgi:hypothetical protein